MLIIITHIRTAPQAAALFKELLRRGYLPNHRWQDNGLHWYSRPDEFAAACYTSRGTRTGVFSSNYDSWCFSLNLGSDKKITSLGHCNHLYYKNQEGYRDARTITCAAFLAGCPLEGLGRNVGLVGEVKGLV